MKVDEKADDPLVRKRKRRNNLVGALGMLIIAVLANFAGVMWLRNLLGIVIILSLVNFFVLRDASFFFQNKILPILESAYNRFIKGALYKYMPIGIFIGSFLLLIAALGLLGSNMPKVELFPKADPIYVNAFVELPLGRDIEATDRILKDMEVKVEKSLEPYAEIVEAVLSQIGEDTADPNAGPAFGASPNRARLTVSFVPARERGQLSSADAMETIREAVQGYPGVQVVVDQNAEGPPQGKDINIEIRGEEVDQLAVLSEDLIAFINSKSIPGIEELKVDVQIGKPEMIVHIDREAARTYQVSTFAIADAIRTSVFGKEISKYKEGEDEYPITLRLDEQYRYSTGDILNQKITFRNPANGRIAQVPVSTVADISYGASYNSINRKDQERAITIFSNVVEGYNANEVVEELKSLLTTFDMPADYTYEFTGQQEEMAEQMEFLSSAFMVALFAIFLILVAQFNSIVSPFIIVLSIVFSTIGVFLGYVFTNMDIIIVMTGVGIISLAGIVVNNAIVLVDYINLLLKRKQDELGIKSIYDLSKGEVKEAIILGGATRLRPVLLTAITTVLGLVPLAIGFNFNFFTFIARLDPEFFLGGDNAAFWGTMAWTVIYGLVFATFLTLIVVPVMYWLAYRFNFAFRNVFSRGKTSEASDMELAE